MKNFKNMTDFAAALGLSRSTVSYVLNGKSEERNIKKETAERVLEFARENNFIPSFFGQAIKGMISTDVAIMLPATPFEHHKQVFFELIAEFQRLKLRYIVLPLLEQGENLESLERIRSFKVRNVIIISAATMWEPEQFDWWRTIACQHDEINFFFYDFRYELAPGRETLPDNFYTTGFNRFTAYCRVVRFVAECGYHSLISYRFLGLPEAEAVAAECDLQLIRPPSLPPNADLVHYGRVVAGQLLERDRPERPTAVFVSNDIATASAIECLEENGFGVPETYAFISWDSLFITRFFARKLTSLEVPRAKMLEMTIRFVRGEAIPRHFEVETEIKVGDTLHG